MHYILVFVCVCEFVCMYFPALTLVVPDWNNFKVAALAKYLGFFLGPGVDEHSWTAPISKWKIRKTECSNAGASPTITTLFYNSRAVSVLQYVGQFQLPCKEIITQANHHANSLWHTAPNTITAIFLEKISVYGGLNLINVPNACRAALIRACTKTYDWHTPLSRLREAAADDAHCFPIARQARDTPWPAFWQSPALCWTLGRLHEGTFHSGSPALDVALAAAVDAAKNSQFPQKAAYASLQKSFEGPPIHLFIAARLLKHFPDEKQTLDLVDWSAWRKISRKQSPKVLHSVLKSWLGGWTTSRRFHEDVMLPCFACGLAHADCWKHYVYCQHFWRPLFIAFDLDPDYSFKSVLALQFKPSQLAVLSAAFDMYHTLKHSFLPDICRGAAVAAPPAPHEALHLVILPVARAAARRSCIVGV